MQETIETAVRKHFKPEFINRLDGVVIFRPLDRTSLHKVVYLELQKVRNRLARKHILITLDQKAEDFLVEKGYQPEMGARPVRRVIETYLEDPLAEKLLQNPDKGASLLATVQNDKIVFIEQEAPQVDVKTPLSLTAKPGS